MDEITPGLVHLLANPYHIKRQDIPEELDIDSKIILLLGNKFPEIDIEMFDAEIIFTKIESILIECSKDKIITSVIEEIIHSIEDE